MANKENKPGQPSEQDERAFLAESGDPQLMVLCLLNDEFAERVIYTTGWAKSCAPDAAAVDAWTESHSLPCTGCAQEVFVGGREFYIGAVWHEDHPREKGRMVLCFELHEDPYNATRSVECRAEEVALRIAKQWEEDAAAAGEIVGDGRRVYQGASNEAPEAA